jgi:hypothetical protein
VTLFRCAGAVSLPMIGRRASLADPHQETYSSGVGPARLFSQSRRTSDFKMTSLPLTCSVCPDWPSSQRSSLGLTTADRVRSVCLCTASREGEGAPGIVACHGATYEPMTPRGSSCALREAEEGRACSGVSSKESTIGASTFTPEPRVRESRLLLRIMGRVKDVLGGQRYHGMRISGSSPLPRVRT